MGHQPTVGTYDYKSCRVNKPNAKENMEPSNLFYGDDNIHLLQ